MCVCVCDLAQLMDGEPMIVFMDFILTSIPSDPNSKVEEEESEILKREDE